MCAFEGTDIAKYQNYAYLFLVMIRELPGLLLNSQAYIFKIQC